MKANDFVAQNNDVLIRRLTEEDFLSLMDGTVLFCITVCGGSKPAIERTVRTAGYQMVVATDSSPKEVMTLALTTNGYAKVDHITLCDMADNGTKLIYECRPLPQNDPRRNHHWLLSMEEA